MSPPAPAAEDHAAILEDAAQLLALAMHESHGPVDALAGALARMAAAVGQCARALERGRAGAPSAPAVGSRRPLRESALRDLAAAHQCLEREIALCIESLQFHDRLIQRLERVSRSLGGCESATPDVLCGTAAQGTYGTAGQLPYGTYAGNQQAIINAQNALSQGAQGAFGLDTNTLNALASYLGLGQTATQTAQAGQAQQFQQQQILGSQAGSALSNLANLFKSTGGAGTNVYGMGGGLSTAGEITNPTNAPGVGSPFFGGFY